MATRGLSTEEIKQSALWWHGPPWLRDNQLTWPVWDLPEITSECLEETRKSTPCIEVTGVVGVNRKGDDTFLFGLSEPRYSSLRKLLRILVYVLRFIKVKVLNKLQEETKQKFNLLFSLFRSLSNNGPVTRLDIKISASLHVYFIQHCRFKEIFLAIKNKKCHCLLKQLGI